MTFPELLLQFRPTEGPPIDARLRGARPSTTLADLAALAVPGRTPLRVAVDGRVVSAAMPLADAGLRCGSELSWPGTDDDVGRDLASVEVVTGPDWGRVLGLGAGRTVIGGRSGSLDDPTAASHHALAEAGPGGAVRWTSLGVGRPLEETPSGDVRIGATELRSGPPDPVPERIGREVAGRTVIGRVARPERPVEPPLTAPAEAETSPTGPSGVGMISSSVAVGVGVVAGLVLGQPTMVLLSCLGALGGFIAAAVHHVRHRRARAAALAELDRAWDEYHDRLERAIGAMEARLHGRAPWRIGRHVTVPELWQRRLRPHEAISLTVGRGAVEWSPHDGASVVLEEVGVPLDLAPGAVVVVTGPPDAVSRVVRSIVLQHACAHGPADLVLAGDGPGEPWWDWLPHLAPDRLERAGGDDRPVLAVTSDVAALSVRTSPVRRFLERGDPGWLVVAAPGEAVAPGVCTHLVRLTASGVGELIALSGTPVAAGGPQRFRWCGVGSASAGRLARFLTGCTDPELLPTRAALPTTVELGELWGEGALTSAAIGRRWAAAGSDPAPRAVVGRAADGLVEIDLHRDGPHALLAGTTGAGKSEALRTLVASLAVACPPDALRFVLVDYKGGSAFDRCAALPHVAGMVTDLDDRLGARMLGALDAELRRRERLLRRAGATDLTAYRAAPARPPLARLVVVIDEFAALATELPEFLNSLVSVAQRGRSLGVHLVLATQRPAGVVNDDIRANTNLRLCLRVQDPSDALDVLGDRRPAELPRQHPGRAWLRIGTDEPVLFQTARCTGPSIETTGPVLEPLGGPVMGEASDRVGPTALDRLVDEITAAWGGAPGGDDAIWSDPLPQRVIVDDPGVIGSVDDIAGQCRRPLTFPEGSGHLAVAGLVGSGVTTALRRLAEVFVTRTPADHHLYVVDGDGSGAFDDFVRLPHCGGVVGNGDDEALARLLAVLESPRPPASTLVILDGVGALRSRLAAPERIELAERIERFVAEAAGRGITIAFGADHPGALPAAWLGRCTSRWIGRLADRVDATAFGLPPAAAIVDGPSGRFVVEFDDGRAIDAQIASPGSPVAPCLEGEATVVPIGVIPAVVDGSALPGPRRDGSSIAISVGLGVTAPGWAWLTVGGGDRVAVIGPARSGRSSLVRLLAGQFEIAGATVVAVDGPDAVPEVAARIERSLGDGQDVVLVIDDAERLDDPDGALAALLAARRRELRVVASARPDGLRSAGYGHWTAALRRPSAAVALGRLDEHDLDALGIVVPRRRLPSSVVAPGRGLLVADGRADAVQFALDQRGSALVGSTGHECFG